MGPVTDTTFSVNAKSLAAMRAARGSAPPLPEPLRAAAAEPLIRLRTDLVCAAIEAAPDPEAVADWITSVWRGAAAGDRGALRCLTSLLEVRLSGIELLRRAAGAGQLLRACRREARGALAPPGTSELVRAAQATMSRLGIDPQAVHTPESAQRLRQRTAELLVALVEHRLQPVELAWLTEIAELEMRATALLLGALAERVGACDGRLISRLLPVLSKQEERLRDTRALLVKLPAPRELVRRTPVLLTRLEDKGFDAVVRELASRPEGADAARAFVLATWRAPLGPELAFFGGIVRLVGDRLRCPVDPAHALLLALQARRDAGLALELSAAERRATKALWDALGVETQSGEFCVRFDAARHERLLADDLVPELEAPGKQAPVDVRRLVLSNIANEHVICGLLQSPKVSSLPGLVEQIVIRTRSLKVLLEVANRRELHGGAANRNVPRVLLWHPAGVPVSALRKFVHVRYIDRLELASMASRGSRARPEIRQMAAQYLASINSA